MTDEKYTFIEDCREKKHTGRSYYNRVTHGGKVRLPSDNLTKKELRKMSGEAKSYRMNEPMKWDDFKTMPEDLQKAYILAIRDKYHVSDSKIFTELFGVSQKTGSQKAARLGISLGRHAHHEKADLDGWRKWLNGNSQKIAEATIAQATVPCEVGEFVNAAVEAIMPLCGSMTFDGNAQQALGAIGMILKDSKVRLTVTWSVAEGDM